eukprot:8350495-Prorocentrum_lima.AAC.1
MPIAMNNLFIAQHRDSLRYAQRRGGAYMARQLRFRPGQYVFLRTQLKHTLDVEAGPTILRIVAIKPSGVAILEGADGSRTTDNVSNLSPCSLPNLVHDLQPHTSRRVKDAQCQVCHRVDQAESMLLCDQCNCGWHMQCLQPVVTSIPEGDWFCPVCTAAQFTSRSLTAVTAALVLVRSLSS